MTFDPRQAIAHTINDHGVRQPLTEHLDAVSQLTEEFAAAFGAEEMGRLLGLWHDIGKFNPAFQQYLLDAEANPGTRRRGPDHKAAGAQLAAQVAGPTALAIHGHHGGLTTPADLRAWLQQRTADPAVAESIALARAIYPKVTSNDQPLPKPVAGQDRLDLEMLIRVLLSALVDADRLDTERHFDGTRANLRATPWTMEELWERFARDQEEFDRARAAERSVNAEVLSIRRAIYRDCLRAADEPPGFFRLTVPTGGGKTRSGLAFALRHAHLHGLRRVVVAVPFISITEQTADVYRRILEHPDDPHQIVLEHHSGVVDPEDAGGGADPTAVWRRLAAENWDAPVVVTTTVQLFESLFANRTGAVRKLHRLARSVIILDEVQALPSHLLAPMLDVLRQLAASYGSTVVLSTATQPAFEAIKVFAQVPAREIVPNPARFFTPLRRVEYTLLMGDPLDWESAADLLRQESQALAVLNTKSDAIALFDALDDPDALHLSTLLCGAHRRQVLQEVRRRLEADEPCRLISTQVVEAGVDLDFPFVLRAVGPLDAIVQAAGRCNREGRLERGRVVVFQPADGALPQGSYRIATANTRTFLSDPAVDLHDPRVYSAYFRTLFQTIDPDRERIQAHRARLDYPEVSRLFQMIEPSESVVVTGFGTSEERQAVRRGLEALRSRRPGARATLRRLQPFVVSMPSYLAERSHQEGLINEIMPGFGEWHGDYDQARGLMADHLSHLIV